MIKEMARVILTSESFRNSLVINAMFLNGFVNLLRSYSVDNY